MRRSDYLIHYGVQGMRWGHRKDRRSTDSNSKKSSRKQKITGKISEKISKTRSKSSKNMSDEALKKAIARMELERRYNSLNRENVSAGKRFARDILKNSAQQVVTSIIIGGVRVGIKEATGVDLMGGFKKKK